MKIEWNSFDRGVFLINCLAIIYKNGKILIGKREADQYVKELTWSFPGGRPTYDKPLEDSLKDEVKKKTGFDIDVTKLVFARNYPEEPKFISLYYLAKIIGGKEKTGEKFTEIKWVKPSEVTRFFTTSVDNFIIKFLKKLEKKK